MKNARNYKLWPSENFVHRIFLIVSGVWTVQWYLEPPNPAECLSDMTDSEPVHQTVCHASLAGPGVDGGTLLAGPHVPHTGLVPEVTHPGLVTPRRARLQISGLGSTRAFLVWSSLPCNYNQKVRSPECCPERLDF